MLRAAATRHELRSAGLALIGRSAGELQGTRAILLHTPAAGEGIGKCHLRRRIAAPRGPKEPGSSHGIILRAALAIGSHGAKQGFGGRHPTLGKNAEQPAGFDMITTMKGSKARIHQLVTGSGCSKAQAVSRSSGCGSLRHGR